jgi:NAD(P)-dependent dehydrogenase (short-subunit alcohol dehydrogenase family)
MSAALWTTGDVSDQHGRVALVTEANTGLGFETARMLAGHGATVVLACRDQAKMRDAAARLSATVPRGEVTTLSLDLASLASIRIAATEFRDRYNRLDLLVNNAGLMIPPYGRTVDGFESQFGVNHLGHFALTGLLIDRLLHTPDSRIVTVSSNAHRRGTINFDDLQAERGYRPMVAYSQSKLANLLFTYELQRRLTAARASTIALAAHPGAARTDLMRHSPRLFRFVASPRTRILFSWLIQDEDAGRCQPCAPPRILTHAVALLRPQRLERVHRPAPGTSRVDVPLTRRPTPTKAVARLRAAHRRPLRACGSPHRPAGQIVTIERATPAVGERVYGDCVALSRNGCAVGQVRCGRDWARRAARCHRERAD